MYIQTTATASDDKISCFGSTAKYPTFIDRYTAMTNGKAIHIALGMFLK